MKLLPMSSKDQRADFFTKSVLPQPLHLLLSKLGLVDIYHPPTFGGILPIASEKSPDNEPQVN
jgi:hypothetical protein